MNMRIVRFKPEFDNNMAKMIVDFKPRILNASKQFSASKLMYTISYKNIERQTLLKLFQEEIVSLNSL